MIIDYLLQFTEDAGQTITAAAGSDYCIDFGQTAPTTGYDPAQPVAVFTVKADVAGDLLITLQDCDTETGTYTDCAASVQLASPAAGTQVVIPIPYRHKRYMQAYFGGTPTAGVVSGFITSGFQDNPGFEQAPSIKTA